MHHLNYDWHTNFTPQERGALIPRVQINPFIEQARKLVEWCNEPWLSEMDKSRYMLWANEFENKFIS